MRRTLTCAFVILSAFSSLAAAKSSKCDVALKRIDALLVVYDKDHPLKHYPSTLKELHNYGARNAVPLDLSCFSDFSYKRSGTSLTILYTCKETGLSGAVGHDTIIVY